MSGPRRGMTEAGPAAAGPSLIITAGRALPERAGGSRQQALAIETAPAALSPEPG
jgi:hypothetical protein